MTGDERRAEAFGRAVAAGRISRRELLGRAAALGLSGSALSALLAACGGDDETPAQGSGGGGGNGTTTSGEPYKVGFVYVGPPGDAGWTFRHDEGRKHLEETVPNVQTTFLENVPEANAGPAFDQLIADGHKMIFATSFGYGDAVLQRARQHPDVIFQHCSGLERAENVSTYYANHWDGMYVIGTVAGRLTQADRLGFVGSFAIPDVIVDANAFTLGARASNPNATTRAVLINTWYDPPKEKQAARTLIDAGVDVLSGVEDSPAILEEAANHEGVLAATWNSDMSQFGPQAFVSAVVFNWNTYYVSEVEKAIAGEWESQDFWGSLDDGTVELAPWGESVPLEVQEEADATLAAINEGSFKPFAGPISDSKGQVRVEEGDEMSFEEILGWDWYVEGVEGSLPA